MKHNKSIWGWVMYDWANSAFATSVMGVFFPVFFKEFWCSGLDVNRSTLMLGLTNSIATLVVVISAPILGAVADQGSSKKKFLLGFAYLGVITTSLLFLLGEGRWLMASSIFGLAVIGFSAANIFYDALLPTVADEEKIDFISGLGFAFGYLGGGILLCLNTLMVQKPVWFGLASSAEAVRVAFLTVGIWWGLFSLPLIKWVREIKRHLKPSKSILIIGFEKVIQTFRKIRSMPMTFMFLVAYWLYIDGVDTIVRMAADFGLSIGFASSDIILAFLITQFVGFPCAILFGKLGEKWDVKKSILIAIGIYIFVSQYGMLMTKTYEFYMLAVIIGFVQGGVQALSRSFYSRLIPPNQEAEFYGFYNMLGKFAAIIGPVLMGTIGVLVRSMGFSANTASRSGIGSIIILFILGGILLYKVDEKRGHQDALAAY